MSVMSDQFKFSAISYKTARSREIGSSAPPQRVGVNSAQVDCACGHSWFASSGRSLDGVMGGVLVTCPAGRASESITGRYLGI